MIHSLEHVKEASVNAPVSYKMGTIWINLCLGWMIHITLSMDDMRFKGMDGLIEMRFGCTCLIPVGLLMMAYTPEGRVILRMWIAEGVNWFDGTSPLFPFEVFYPFVPIWFFILWVCSTFMSITELCMGKVVMRHLLIVTLPFLVEAYILGYRLVKSWFL
jgi:hypothetical protein